MDREGNILRSGPISIGVLRKGFSRTGWDCSVSDSELSKASQLRRMDGRVPAEDAAAGIWGGTVLPCLGRSLELQDV